MDVIELDKLVICLEQIVAYFDSNVIDFSYNLTIQLVNSYQKLIEIDPDEDNHEAEIASSCCLKAILKIMRICGNNEILYSKVERVKYIITYSV